MFLETQRSLWGPSQMLCKNHFKFGVYLWITNLVPWPCRYFYPLRNGLLQGSRITDISWEIVCICVILQNLWSTAAFRFHTQAFAFCLYFHFPCFLSLPDTHMLCFLLNQSNHYLLKCSLLEMLSSPLYLTWHPTTAISHYSLPFLISFVNIFTN